MLKFEDAEIDKNEFYHHKTPVFPIFFLRDVDIEKVLISNKRFPLVKKTISTLLVTCIMIIKLSHYI